MGSPYNVEYPATGRSIVSSLKQGTIVGKHTPGGGIQGFDPHKPGKVRINPAPDGTGGFEVDLSTITAEQLKEVTSSGQAIRQAKSYEQIGEAASDSFAKLASLQERKAGSMYPNKFSRRSTDQSFQQPQVHTAPYVHVEPAQPRMPSPPLAAPPPQRQANFELPDGDALEAFYHEITANDQLLVLAFNKRFQGGFRYHPRTSASILVDVPDLGSVFEVRSCGPSVSFQDYDLSIFLIEKVIPHDQVFGAPHGEERLHRSGMDPQNGFDAPERLGQ